ncbi:hypothetical protein R1flu_019086 [Riccia fluitans]|uniref:Transforming acidic coiled-coil-containing protein C-terminal domain-containing protein n=1 Tax=Riccia fluitans TaxID=41844 RepID=A0ABD1ZHU5_9MARC
MGVTTPQPVLSSGERSQLTHTPIGAILVEDLNGTSNEDFLAKPPNVSIPFPTPPPSAYYNNCNWRTWTASIDREAIRKGVDCSPPTGHSSARTEVQREMEELKRSVTKLEDFKRSMTAKEKAAEETYMQKLALVQTELEEYKRSSEASIKRLEEEASHLREALAAKQSVVHALENAHQKEISTLKATCRKYKTTLDGEIGTNADLQARVLNLQDELNACKYTQEQALQVQKLARAELLEVKKELRMLQVLHQEVDEGNAASAP